MASDQIYGQNNDKHYQQAVYDHDGRTGIDAQDQGQTGNKFDERHHNGDQIDDPAGKEIIPVDDFCKISGRQDFMIAGVDKGQPQNPAGSQFDPAIFQKIFLQIIQQDNPSLPSLENRR